MPKVYWQGEPDEETRQQYANYHIATLQRTRLLSFAELLDAFRCFGQLYDAGHRLRDIPVSSGDRAA